MSEIYDNNMQEMSTFAYALLENYEVYGNTIEAEYELGSRDKLIQYIGSLENRVAELETEKDHLTFWLASAEGEIDQLTADSDIERQDDKSSNDTQKETFVYGKEDSEVK